MSFNKPPLKELKWYGIDLDGTLAEPVWPDPGIGEPIQDNVDKLIEVYKAGYKIMIHTSRYWGDYALIKAWLKEYNLLQYVKEIQCGKPLYECYVDDKAINASADSWLRV